ASSLVPGVQPLSAPPVEVVPPTAVAPPVELAPPVVAVPPVEVRPPVAVVPPAAVAPVPPLASPPPPLSQALSRAVKEPIVMRDKVVKERMASGYHGTQARRNFQKPRAKKQRKIPRIRQSALACPAPWVRPEEEARRGSMWTELVTRFWPLLPQTWRRSMGAFRWVLPRE